MNNEIPQRNSYLTPDNPTPAEPPASPPIPEPSQAKKVISPVTPGLTAESLAAAQPAKTVSSPTASPPTDQQPAPLAAPANPNPPAATPPPRPDMSSIYPDVTHGATPAEPVSDSPAQPAENLAKQSDKTKIVVACIWLLGTFIAIPAALSLFSSVKILSYGVGGSIIGTVTLIIELIVGVGIILRKDMARVVYVVLAVISLFLSVLTTIGYINAMHNVSKLEAPIIASTQKEITYYQNDKTLPAAERQQTVQRLQHTLADEKKDQNSSLSLYNLIPDYLIALVPLVFLTRPSVKGQFS